MKYWVLIHCFLPRSLCQLLLTFSPVHASPAHLYILHLYTHCLPTMTCVTLTSIWLCIWPNICILIILFLLLFATHIGWIEYFVCKFDLILPVPFLDAFIVLITTIAACHLPLYHYCVAVVFRILVISVRLIPSVVQCYLLHWLNILSIA